jgi:transcriptional regulatory protein RtcR
MSALFGHVKGAFTGAVSDRAGALRTADKGIVFLDEVGELGLDEQAMLLRALEEKRFLPLGADEEVQSDFQLICGSNRDLRAATAEGLFRADLLARIDLWTYELPGLADRPEDIEPNVNYELDRLSAAHGRKVSLNREARQRFLDFAASSHAPWHGNFRDLIGAVTRMSTLASGGRITTDVVEEEIGRLTASWQGSGAAAYAPSPDLEGLVPDVGEIDLFDRAQLAEVIRVCRRTKTLSEAGRVLFAVSRARKRVPNDADRLRKYLARFGLTWDAVRTAG